MAFMSWALAAPVTNASAAPNRLAVKVFEHIAIVLVRVLKPT
jgi:hypothetical protein